MVSGNNQGQFLRAVRDRAQMSQRQLAQLTKHSPAWIQHIESGIRRASVDDLGVLAHHLGLSAWEAQYLYALGGKMAEKTPMPIPDVNDYVDALDPHPAAYLDAAWTVKHANAEFMRLFKGLWLFPNLIYWHYVGRRTRDIMIDWQSSSDWFVSILRWSLAVTPTNPALVDILDQLMPIKTFAQQWEQNIIPADPATRPWDVIDIDNNRSVRIDMRAWQSVGQRSDILLMGVKTGQPPSLEARQPPSGC